MHNVDAAGLGIGDDHPPRIMGVLYVDEQLIDQGADIVDVGLESANKKFEVLSAEGELDRLDTAVETIESVSGDAVFSIETRYHEVAEAALDRGFDMVNDICGFADPEMPRVCADYDVAVAKMASPPDIERPGAIESPDGAAQSAANPERSRGYADDIYDALELNGFTDKTILDPAFGGWSEDKTLEDDRETFRRLREFRGYGYPLLVSINRKNFLRDLAGRSTEDALPVSLAATAMAVERGAHVIRTHDVAETRDAAIIGDAFSRDRLRDPEAGVEELDVTTPEEVERHLTRLGSERSYAADATTRVFELSGLDERAREQLRTQAGTYGASVAEGAGENLLLFGTVGALDRLASGFDGSQTVERALDRIGKSLK